MYLCSKRPKGQVGFFSGLSRHTFPGIPLFLGSDFNCIDSLELDKAAGDSLFGDKGPVELKDFADSLSLCDVLRVHFPRRKLLTRHNKSNTNMSRIDRIYAPKCMISDALGYTFDPCSYSDHDLVSVKFNCKRTLDRSPGLWKFNSSLTMDDEYAGLLSQFLQDWRLQKGRYPDLTTWWDIGKTHIRDITVEFATSKRREKRFQRSNLVRQLGLTVQEPVLSAGVITDLRRQIRDIDEEFISGVIVRSKELRAEQGKKPTEPVPSAGVITDLRRHIRDIDEEFISGVIVRSKELWAEQGEKPTKYFFNLEKMRQQKKEMTELKSHSGELLSDSKDIRKEMNDFHQDLFSEEEVDLEAQDWLLDQFSMSLDEQEQASCEGLLTVEECREALNGMDTGKSPGIDGLTAEFYIAF